MNVEGIELDGVAARERMVGGPTEEERLDGVGSCCYHTVIVGSLKGEEMEGAMSLKRGG